jgi:dCMP deaminase
MIANAGLSKIVYGEFYRDQRIFEFAQKLGIELVKVELGERST